MTPPTMPSDAEGGVRPEGDVRTFPSSSGKLPASHVNRRAGRFRKGRGHILLAALGRFGAGGPLGDAIDFRPFLAQHGIRCQTAFGSQTRRVAMLLTDGEIEHLVMRDPHQIEEAKLVEGAGLGEGWRQNNN